MILDQRSFPCFPRFARFTKPTVEDHREMHNQSSFR
jgi:hypothetical protein